MSRVEHIGDATLYLGDCLEVLPTLRSVDAVVTDPPYHLTSIVKRFGGENAAPAKHGKDGAFARASRGFMGKVWDGGDIAFQPGTWRLVYDAMKPGAHLCAFGGTRTFHRMVCAIEDAGFEIRDTLMWVYGSGFPKSHDVSKGIDRAAGAVREVVGPKVYGEGATYGAQPSGRRTGGIMGEVAERGVSMDTAPATPEAAQWNGWGTALKPAVESIVLARKPLGEKTVAANVLAHGTGAINIDACRIASDTPIQSAAGATGFGADREDNYVLGIGRHYPDKSLGRWPANLCHDGSDEVTRLFPVADSPRANGNPNERTKGRSGMFSAGDGVPDYRDTGNASRFFYCAKADAEDRAGSKHPTVKPRALMRWLVRLITPPGGTVLDCFAGTGSTLQAALAEGFHAIGIERDEQYFADAVRRLQRVHGIDAPLFQAEFTQDACVADLFAEQPL